MIADFVDVERAFLFAVADSRADRGDHRLDFLVLKRAVKAGFLDVDQLSTEGQNRLGPTVAALFGGATGGVTFDNIKLGFRRVAFGAIGEFPGKPTAGQGGFPNGFASFSRGFAGTSRVEGFFDDPFRKRRIFVEKLHQTFVNDGGNDPFDLGVDELIFRLRVEARVRHFHRNHGDEAFANIVPGERDVLVFYDLVDLRVLIDAASQRGPESGQVSAAVTVRDRVGETENLIVVGIVVLENHVGKNIVGRLFAVVIQFDRALSVENDRFVVDDGLVFAQLNDELLNPLGVVKRILSGGFGTLVFQFDREARVQERQLTKAGRQPVELEFDGIDENRRIREKGNHRTGFTRIDFADHMQRFRGFPAFEADQMDFSIAHDFSFEPIGKRVDALCTDPVKTTGVFISALAEFPACVKIGEHELNGGHAEFFVHVDRNAPAIVRDRNRTIDVNRNFDQAAIACEVLVDRVIQHFENAVVEATLIGIADIHAGPLADGFQALQLVNLRGAIFLLGPNLSFGFVCLVRSLGHIRPKSLKS